MAATAFPQNMQYVGGAKPLALDQAFQPNPSGNVTLIVSGRASVQGWPSIQSGKKMVVTVGRGTAYEQKHLISQISEGTTTTTLTVLEADRNYDQTPPVPCPAGTTVEHTISATEMATINDHMRTKRAHGSDGELVDQASAQTLSNKTLNGSTLNNPVLAEARFTPVGAIMLWAKDTVPEGWLVCDGQPITAQNYPDLFAMFGATVPNLNGAFVKGGATPNLTRQGSATKTLTEANMPAHKHDAYVSRTEMRPHSHGGLTGDGGAHDHSVTGTASNPNGGYTTGAGNTYDNIQGSGSRQVIGYNPFSLNLAPHTHPVTGATDAEPNHKHAIPSDTAYVGVEVADVVKGSGTPFNAEPEHVVLRYIICAKPQGAV